MTADWLLAEIEYYSPILIDQDLLDRAVVVENVVLAYSVLDQNGVRLCGPRDRGVYCVPAGGSRRGGCVGFLDTPEVRQKVVDALDGVPGFPRPRADGNEVIWGDDPPEIPDRYDPFKTFHRDWLCGRYFGYSLTAIVFQLGRQAAMMVEPDFLKLEGAADYSQIRGSESLRSRVAFLKAELELHYSACPEFYGKATPGA